MMKSADPSLTQHRMGFVVLTLLVAGCSGDAVINDVGPDDRGALLDSHPLETLSEAEILSFGLPITVGSDVELRRIIYRTVDARGEPVDASALLAIPVHRSGAAPLVSYQHGTLVRKSDVASIQASADAEALVAVAFATDGYLVVMPDYLGLGVAPGLHPFVHASTLATAVVDAMRAARHYAGRNSITLDERVFLIGYSEGGYATAAAQRAIEGDYADEFLLAASAPMAAPWDLSGTMFELFNSDASYGEPHFLPYFLLAYNEVYDLEDDLSRLFVSPYDATILPLFDGTRSGGEIDRHLPAIPRQMLAPGFVEAYGGAAPFIWRDRVEENDLVDWSPATRTRIYHCVNDDLVPFSNAETAIASFRARGIPEQRIDLSSGDFGTHVECAPVFLLMGKIWIDGIRSGSVAKAPPTPEEILRTGWRPIR